MYFFGKFRVRAGSEDAFEKAARTMVGPSRDEVGCVSLQVFRGLRERNVFYVHSRWVDEEAFALHATLEHTRKFLEEVQGLVEEEPEFTRTRLVV